MTKLIVSGKEVEADESGNYTDEGGTLRNVQADESEQMRHEKRKRLGLPTFPDAVTQRYGPCVREACESLYNTLVLLETLGEDELEQVSHIVTMGVVNLSVLVRAAKEGPSV
jgi:hypothetical protein